MAIQWERVFEAIGTGLGRAGRGIAQGVTAVAIGLRRIWIPGLVLAAIGLAGYGIYRDPPLQHLAQGEVGIRTNVLISGETELREGTVLVIPALQQLRRYSLRDQIYRPEQNDEPGSTPPFQSAEGLSIGVDLSVRYALDPDKIASVISKLPDDIGTEIVQPAVQGIIYKVLTRYSVREIFSTKRDEIQKTLEDDLRPQLATDGILLRSVQMGKVDLPADYRAGMDQLLAAELASEKMQYTLALKEKEVKQSELEAEAVKVRSDKAAEAAGDEQIIAAKAQEEAMKHVLPFKQKQIEQRQLEAEADKVSRIRTAEGTAEARRIEAQGEADSRVKLADAEAYREERMGKIASAALERDGELLTKNPLLIEKTMADKLSDKVQVIIAPSPVSGGFIGSALLGQAQSQAQIQSRATQPEAPGNGRSEP